MARHADDGVTEIELGRPAPPALPAIPTPARRSSRDQAWRWLVVAVLLTTAGVIAAPAHTPTDGLNLVASLALPPSLAWQTPVAAGAGPADGMGTRLDAEVVGDAVVVTTDTAVTTLDRGSGALLSRTAVDRGRCTYQEQVVCVTGRDSGAAVVTIDPRSGRVERVALPDAAWALRIDGDVVALRYAERRQTVVRSDPAGRPRWTTEVPYQPGVGGTATGYPFARIGDRLYVGTAGPAVLDVDTGATLGRPLALRYDTSGIFGLGFNETWWHLWSGEHVELAEGAARLAVDDDVGGQPVLVSAATGITEVWEPADRPLWSGAGGEQPLARLAGVLVTADERLGTSSGIDLRTGAELWTGESLACPCLGAGDVLLTSASAAVPAGLTATDVRTGLPTWQLAFTPGTRLVELVDGGAVVVGSGSIALYAW